MNRDKFNVKKSRNPFKLIAQSTDIHISTGVHFVTFIKSGKIDLTNSDESNLQTSKVQSYNGYTTIHYRKSKPYFDVISTHHFVRNSAKLLLSKNKKSPNKYFYGSDTSSTITVKSDPDRITLVANLIQ